MWKLHSQEDRFRKHTTFTKITKTFEINSIKKMFERKWLAKGTTQCRDGITKTIITNSIYCFDFRFFWQKHSKNWSERGGKKHLSIHGGGVSKWMNFLCLGGPLTAQAKELTTTGSGHCQPNFWKPLFMIGPKILHPMQLRATNLNVHKDNMLSICHVIAVKVVCRADGFHQCHDPQVGLR